MKNNGKAISKPEERFLFCHVAGLNVRIIASCVGADVQADRPGFNHDATDLAEFADKRAEFLQWRDVDGFDE